MDKDNNTDNEEVVWYDNDKLSKYETQNNKLVRLYCESKEDVFELSKEVVALLRKDGAYRKVAFVKSKDGDSCYVTAYPTTPSMLIRISNHPKKATPKDVKLPTDSEWKYETVEEMPEENTINVTNNRITARGKAHVKTAISIAMSMYRHDRAEISNILDNSINKK